MKTIGIVAHSAEGSALCYITACRYGGQLLGPHMHPPIVMSAIPMALSMPGWETGRHSEVAAHLAAGVRQTAAAGADFYVCPDNTAHIVLEQIAADMPIPGLHIAEVVCSEIKRQQWKRAAVLGTNWTMTGPVYAQMLAKHAIEPLIPETPVRARIHDFIFSELCQGVFREESRAYFVQAIRDLQREGADCVVLGCTEIPLIIDDTNSPLPTLDSTRLMARKAVDVALGEAPLNSAQGWIKLGAG